MLESQLRIVVHQLSGRHEVPGHGVGGVALQAPQVAAHVGVEPGGRDVVGQGRLGHPGRGRTVGPLPRIGEPPTATRSGALATIRAPVAPEPGLVTPACTAIRPSGRTPFPLGCATPIAPGTLLGLPPRLLPVIPSPLTTGAVVTGTALVLAVRPRASLASRPVVPTTARIPAIHPRTPLTTGPVVTATTLVLALRPRAALATGPVVPTTARIPAIHPRTPLTTGPVVTGTALVPALRPRAALTTGPVIPTAPRRAAIHPRTPLAPGAVVPGARDVLPAPGAAVPAPVITPVRALRPLATAAVLAIAPLRRARSVALPATTRLATTGTPALLVRPATAAITLAPVLALLPVTAAIAAALPAVVLVAIAAPPGSEPGLLALPAAPVLAPWAGFPIIGSAAAVAIFSRAVIAGTIRDTHL
ncbi:hypothetical protein [Pseudonocardia sp. DLS-67]